MTLNDLDDLIRAAMNDSSARRDILTGVGDITEAVNIILTPLLMKRTYA